MTPDNSVKLRVGDVVRWEYVENKYTPDRYWCCSRIAEVFENADRELWLHDTYWGDSSNGRSFSVDEIGTKLEVEFIANTDELEPCNKGKFAYYAAEDCIDLSHPNNSNYNVFFIRKGAKKDAGKMKRCLEAHKEYYLRQVEYNRQYAEDMQKRIDTFDESDLDNMYLPNEKNVWWE